METSKPLVQILMDLVEGICPSCGGTDLHSASIDSDEAVSCCECNWISSYKALRARTPADETTAKPQCLAMTDEFASEVCSLPESHGGPHRWVTPEKASETPRHDFRGPTVACRCGWFGHPNALAGLKCPKCSAEFK